MEIKKNALRWAERELISRVFYPDTYTITYITKSDNSTLYLYQRNKKK